MTTKKAGTGRVTPKKADQARANRGGAAGEHPARPQPRRTSAPTESPRYTPPKASYRIRPRWHRVAGWAGVTLGVLIAIANDTMLIADHLTLLPFGHQELYLILGVLVAGGSTWFLGLFDRGTTIYD